MSTNRAVMPRWADSGVPVRTSSTQRWAYWARLVHTFWPVTCQPSSARTARQASDARLLPASGSEKPWHQVSSPRSSRGHHLGRQLGRGVVDHRRRQDLGHRVDARLDEVPGRSAPRRGRPAAAMDPPRPPTRSGQPQRIQPASYARRFTWESCAMWSSSDAARGVVAAELGVVRRRARRRATSGTRRGPCGAVPGPVRRRWAGGGWGRGPGRRRGRRSCAGTSSTGCAAASRASVRR